MSKTTWQLENEALENAFARRLLVEYNIKEVTTQRQAKNETRVFEFPVPARKRLPNGKRLQLACFKTGYVRNQNSCYSNYQLNPVYKQEQRQIFLTENGALKTMKYEGITRTKIWNSMARMKFMLDFYIRNYNVNTITNG